MANAITFSRIILSFSLLFTIPFSFVFYVLYLTAGLTDALDGHAARKTNSESDFGAKLDSAADFVFVAVCFFKLSPFLKIPAILLIWIIAIAIVRIANVALGYIYFKRLIAEHTAANKLTGAALFLLPLTMPIINLNIAVVVIASIATYASLEEGILIANSRIIKG